MPKTCFIGSTEVASRWMARCACKVGIGRDWNELLGTPVKLVLLCCCARPPFAGERLAMLEEGKVAYRLPKPDLNGRTFLVMDPLELLDKLAKLIPPPRAHMVRYFGVLAPNSHMRERAIESAGPSGEIQVRLEEAAQKMGLVSKPSDAPTSEPAPSNIRASAVDQKKASRMWAMLIARIYGAFRVVCGPRILRVPSPVFGGEVLPLLCPHCNQPMKIVALITEPSSISGILRHIGAPKGTANTAEPTKPPPLQPARAPPQQDFEFIDTEPIWP